MNGTICSEEFQISPEMVAKQKFGNGPEKLFKENVQVKNQIYVN